MGAACTSSSGTSGASSVGRTALYTARHYANGACVTGFQTLGGLWVEVRQRKGKNHSQEGKECPHSVGRLGLR